MTANEKVALSYGDKTVDLPILHSAEGPDAIDVSKLLATTGLTAYDQGFVNTASTKSAITYIDGDAGVLRYRGYPIEQLAEKKSLLVRGMNFPMKLKVHC